VPGFLSNNHTPWEPVELPEPELGGLMRSFKAFVLSDTVRRYIRKSVSAQLCRAPRELERYRGGVRDGACGGMGGIES
jgi:hypothetical protein